MQKYRIRLRNGRVIGPFINNQLLELKSKGHIQGNEEAQIFPTGEWLPISEFDFFHELDGKKIEDPPLALVAKMLFSIDKT